MRFFCYNADHVNYVLRHWRSRWAATKGHGIGKEGDLELFISRLNTFLAERTPSDDDPSPLESKHVEKVIRSMIEAGELGEQTGKILKNWLDTEGREAVEQCHELTRLENHIKATIPSNRRGKGFVLASKAQIEDFCDALDAVASRYMYGMDMPEVGRVLFDVSLQLSEKPVLTPAVIKEFFTHPEFQISHISLHSTFRSTMDMAHGALLDVVDNYRAPPALGMQ